MDVYTSEYMIDGNQMGIVGENSTFWTRVHLYMHQVTVQHKLNVILLSVCIVSDSDKNLIIYQYQPEGQYIE